jgi:hypothetical protein
MAFKTGSGATLKTAITNDRLIQGNLTGRSGSWDTVVLSGSILQVRLDLSSGQVFNVNPEYSSGISDLSFRFINYSPRKKIEFYLLWQNYKDSYNSSNYAFNYVFSSPSITQEVRFPAGVTTLNNSSSGLLDGKTQIFKFNTISGGEVQSLSTTPPAWFGSLYMKNCPPNVFPDY